MDEEQFILRLPDALANMVRASLRASAKKKQRTGLASFHNPAPIDIDGDDDDEDHEQHNASTQEPKPAVGFDIQEQPIKITFLNERQATVTIQNEDYPATLMDLPCIVESHKSLDKKTLFKSNDIHQVLVVRTKDQPPMSSELLEHGLTPASKNAKKRLAISEPPFTSEQVASVEAQIKYVVDHKVSFVQKKEVPGSKGDEGKVGPSGLSAAALSGKASPALSIGGGPMSKSPSSADFLADDNLGGMEADENAMDDLAEFLGANLMDQAPPSAPSKHQGAVPKVPPSKQEPRKVKSEPAESTKAKSPSAALGAQSPTTSAVLPPFYTPSSPPAVLASPARGASPSNQSPDASGQETASGAASPQKPEFTPLSSPAGAAASAIAKPADKEAIKREIAGLQKEVASLRDQISRMANPVVKAKIQKRLDTQLALIEEKSKQLG